MLEKEPAWPVLLHCCKQDEMQLFKKQICLKNSKYHILAARAQQLAAAGTRELEGCSPPFSFPPFLPRAAAAAPQSMAEGHIQRLLSARFQPPQGQSCIPRSSYCCCWAKQWYLRILCAGFCNEMNVIIYRSHWGFSFQCPAACICFFFCLFFIGQDEFSVKV